MSYDIKLEMVPVLVCAVTDTLRDFRMPDAVLDRKDVSDIHSLASHAVGLFRICVV
jgi:hypothetical protein